MTDQEKTAGGHTDGFTMTQYDFATRTEEQSDAAEWHRRGPGQSLKDVVDEFCSSIHEAGLDFGREQRELASEFISALTAKPFVIFTGLSGSGKTQLATTLGQWFGRGHLLVQPVRPEWTSPEYLLGSENPHLESHDAVLAWNVPRVLEFLLSAVKHPNDPYLLVLDEMNLAHVEQYFADVLSGMESGQPIVPNLRNDGSGWRMWHEIKYLPWPKNVFLVGTVNLDETTYEFSAKVLDRATCIEFRVPPDALQMNYPKATPIMRGTPALQQLFLHRALSEEPSWQQRDRLGVALQHLHRLLYEYDSEFGHRVFRESLRFGALAADAGVEDVKTILDLILLNKVLPKFKMSQPHERALLQALAGFALYGPGRTVDVDPLEKQTTQPVLPRTYAKLQRLARKMA